MGTGIDKMVEQVTWATNNMAYNLDFIPDEKLNWKPSHTANSAMEIANHMIGSFDWVINLFTGKNVKTDPAKTKKEAQDLLAMKVTVFATLLQGMSEKDLTKTESLPWGDTTREFIAGMEVNDAIHHRGQIVYIQTILGDTEDHFQM